MSFAASPPSVPNASMWHQRMRQACERCAWWAATHIRTILWFGTQPRASLPQPLHAQSWLRTCSAANRSCCLVTMTKSQHWRSIPRAHCLPPPVDSRTRLILPRAFLFGTSRTALCSAASTIITAVFRLWHGQWTASIFYPLVLVRRASSWCGMS